MGKYVLTHMSLKAEEKAEIPWARDTQVPMHAEITQQHRVSEVAVLHPRHTSP